MPINEKLVVRRFTGLQDYRVIWQAMQDFTAQRTSHTVDELWLLQHSPVFTLGQAGKKEHVLDSGDIPLVQSDRGGQVTYHGPGQLIVYLLIDTKRRKLGVRKLVDSMEQALIEVLTEYGIRAHSKQTAPGVYVKTRQNHEEAKIAALGLRIRRGCSYHGLSLNLDMDLAPFAAINPCGYAGLAVTSLAREIGEPIETARVEQQLIGQLAAQWGIGDISEAPASEAG